jgi:hypothetical protein
VRGTTLGHVARESDLDKGHQLFPKKKTPGGVRQACFFARCNILCRSRLCLR